MREALEPMQARIAFAAILLFSLVTIALLGPEETASLARTERLAATPVVLRPAAMRVDAAPIVLGAHTPRPIGSAPVTRM